MTCGESPFFVESCLLETMKPHAMRCNVHSGVSIVQLRKKFSFRSRTIRPQREIRIQLDTLNGSVLLLVQFLVDKTAEPLTRLYCTLYGLVHRYVASVQCRKCALDVDSVAHKLIRQMNLCMEKPVHFAIWCSAWQREAFGVWWFYIVVNCNLFNIIIMFWR